MFIIITIALVVLALATIHTANLAYRRPLPLLPDPRDDLPADYHRRPSPRPADWKCPHPARPRQTINNTINKEIQP